MSERVELYVPTGRFVSGSLTSKRTHNARNQPLPEDKQQFEFGVAVRKDSPQINDFWAQLINGAKQCFAHNPNAHPVIDAWLQNGFNGFSMKVSDGDKISLRTQKANENTVGCWVVWFASLFPINTANNQNVQIDPQMIKRGYYVDVSATIAANSQGIGDGIGIYMNPGLVRLQGIGEEIQTGPSIEQMAASMPAAPALPPGAMDPSQAPIASTPMPNGAAPAPQMQPQAPVAPQVPMQPQAPMQPQMQAPAPTMPPAAPVGGTGAMPPGVPAGTPQVAPVGVPVQPTASPGTPNPQHPPYTGAMNPPVA